MAASHAKTRTHCFSFRLGIIGLILLLTACTTQEAPARPAPDEMSAGAVHTAAEEPAGMGEPPGSTSPAEEAAADGHADDGAIAGAETEADASLPERGIYLHPGTSTGASQTSATLVIGDARQSMNWSYSTVRGVYPMLQTGDYDRDGADELAVVLELGSGTGLLLDELHVVEFEETDGTAERPFVDHTFRPDDYSAQLEAELTFEKVNKDGEWVGRIAIGGRTYEVDLNEFVKEYGAAAIQDKLGYGGIVYFNAGEDGLTARAAVGLVIDNLAEPQYIGNIEAAVGYASGAFKLGGYAFTAEP